MKNSCLIQLYTLSFLFFLAGCSKSNSQSKSVSKVSIEKQIQSKFEKEVLPPASSPCFAGAYYRKIYSSKDYWLGIGGTVTLPVLTYDPSRTNPKKPGAYLDNASVYLGGNSDEQETDIGLTWEVVREADGSVSKEHKAFRPFLRCTGYKSGQTAFYMNAPAEARYYWYPGETVTMSVQLVESKKLKLIVEGAGKKYEQILEVDGYDPAVMAQYKRVNAIDQVANEGKPAQPTTAKVTGAKWSETFLFRSVNGKVVKAPMHAKRFTDMQCPAKSHFKLKPFGKSGESIDIFGSR
ncbi:hypothetical protein [Flavobacterium quisquiliarum]|uniref:Uncharacterized protein n=1 Tax=Flavobacterium quisquiliarum TaxID=1834436 RepID=A0ABV8W9E2_9FLAO|nr:hypothetical protein [Flavobacterium quisquiliarum]MBW1654103.1 hypothetical protein [Flavobacterium quisquiliarum]NWL03411.1 hypothetical protein [Flavobacterium collinsii]